MVFELPQPCSLEPNVVIAVEVVETDNRSTLLEQAVRDMETDETGGSRHQNGFVVRHGKHGASIARSIAPGSHTRSCDERLPCAPSRYRPRAVPTSTTRVSPPPCVRQGKP